MMFNSAHHSEIRVFLVSKDGRDEPLGDHFTLGEMQCPGEDIVLVHPALIAGLDQLRKEIGSPLYISPGGGYRTREYHEGIYHRLNEQRDRRGIAPLSIPQQSAHLFGMAADVSSTGHATPQEIADIAESMDFGGIGLYHNFVHVDVMGQLRRWKGYS